MKRLCVILSCVLWVISPRGAAVAQGASPVSSAVEVVPRVAHAAATATALTVTAGTLGQPITFDATVRAPAAAGAPEGAVEIFVHGELIQTLALSPTNNPAHPNFAYSGASFTLTQQPGGSAYFFGIHGVTAKFIPGTNYLKSGVIKTFTVKRPEYTDLSGGVKIATIAQGSGPAIQAGQGASVLYTGYLAGSGRIFDDSAEGGGGPLNFIVGLGQVISGFDEGTVGMQAGETRIVGIPPKEGYGNKPNGPIPGDSTLIFVITLESIL